MSIHKRYSCMTVFVSLQKKKGDKSGLASDMEVVLCTMKLQKYAFQKGLHNFGQYY